MLKSPIFLLLLLAGLAAVYQASAYEPLMKEAPPATQQSKSNNSMGKASRVTEIGFYDKNGTKITLDHFKGKVVVANLWARWCGPCVSELPSLDRLQRMYGKDLAVVVIAVENTSVPDLRKFLDEHNARGLDVYVDPDMEFPMKWSYQGIPTTFLLDRRGDLYKQYLGAYEWDKQPQLNEIVNAAKRG